MGGCVVTFTGGGAGLVGGGGELVAGGGGLVAGAGGLVGFGAGGCDCFEDVNGTSGFS